MRFAVLAVILFTCACSNDPHVEEGLKAIDTFHQRLAAGDDDAIYNDSTPQFKDGVSRFAFGGTLARIRQRMGTCSGWQTVRVTTKDYPGGTVSSMEGKTHCTKGELTELFAWRFENGVARLYGYTANSPLM